VLQAADAANNLGVSAPTTVRIDHTAPGTVATAIDGGDGWRNANDFNVGWSNPVELDRAPVIASHFRLCPLGSGDCRAERRPGELTRLSHVSLPGPGEWQLRVWLEDAAGNQEPANASVPVTLRYDPEAPTVGFENPTANDPTLVSALVTDKVSGLASGQIELSAQGSGLWRTLSTRQEGNRLVARIDDATLPAGTYVVRATARDRAGNQNTSTQRLDGAPMTLQLPLRTPTALTAGAVIRRAHHRHRRGQRRFSRKSRARVALGSRVRVTGALRTRDGSPLAGADIQVLSRSTGGPERLVAVLHTDEAGRFRYVGRAVATSVLRAVYVGTATTLPAQRQVMVMVPAASTMRARPRHLRNGGVVTFVGRIRSLPVPAGGKLVEVQVILSHHWQTFRTVRTNANGVWRVRYRFRRSCGDLRYSFRARVPAESAYPFEDGHTDPVGVRVRGAPCG
jgi:hypothetical protein